MGVVFALVAIAVGLAGVVIQLDRIATALERRP